MRAVYLAMAALAACSPVFAGEFYEGKKITIIAGTGAGGGHDIFARMLARHLTRHIPGAPAVIVQNMPGAGGTRATEFIYTQAPKDGTMIGGVFPGAIMGPLLDEGATYRYDPLKFAYIGSGDSDTRICATLTTSRITDFAALRKTLGVFGSSGPGGSTHDYAAMAANLAGAKVKIVTGYTGTPPIALAMERGEVDAVCGWGWSIFKSERPDWKSANQFRFLVQMAIQPEAELVALGVPDFYSFVVGEKRKAAELIIGQQAFARPYIGPPGMPKERLETLRRGFSEALEDPELIAEFARINIVNKPTGGAALEQLIAKLYSTPGDIVALARSAQKAPPAK